MTDKMTILMTCVGRRVELIQWLRLAASEVDVDLRILGSDATATAPALRFTDQPIIAPPLSSSSYASWLLDLCTTESVDLVIPTIDTELPILASVRSGEASGLHTRLLVADGQVIATLGDKLLTYEYFVSQGTPTPRVLDPNSDPAGLRYPLFVKPRRGSSSIGATRVDDPVALGNVLATSDEPIVQEFVDGPEYTIDILNDLNGQPVSCVPRVRDATRAGEVSKATIDLDPDVIETALDAIRGLKIPGPATVQCIRSGQGIRVIEVNPRFGGGAPMSMAAGARTMVQLLQLVLGRPVSPMPAHDGMKFARYDQTVRVG